MIYFTTNRYFSVPPILVPCNQLLFAFIMNQHSLFRNKISMEIFHFKVIGCFRGRQLFGLNALYYTIFTVRKQDFIAFFQFTGGYPFF